ncbi:MAG TPA: hypothetical protein VE650_12645 [Acetobacteraceae bacterium]|jgi:hypothetical protein|nr:hypothetical protein [Acetobacteraceae bacterium]
MAEVPTGLLVFAFLAGAALLVLWLHPRLPPQHLSKETTDIVRLGVGVVATITALVLGLLISSVKGGFDQVNHDVQTFATRLILTDRALRLYGPGAEEARALLTRYTELALHETWPQDNRAAVVEDPQAGALLDQAEAAILALPPDPRRPGLADRAGDAIRDVVRQRWALIEESGSTLSPLLILALTLWLGLIFASFGYNAPRNGMVVIVLVVCAASVAGALFLIVEMDGAFTGLIAVSSQPVARALAHMQQQPM